MRINILQQRCYHYAAVIVNEIVTGVYVWFPFRLGSWHQGSTSMLVSTPASMWSEGYCQRKGTCRPCKGQYPCYVEYGAGVAKKNF